MAKSSSNSEKVFVRCLDCAHGRFMQWFDNPIVVYCREDCQRTVAETRRICHLFKPSGIKEPEITHFDRYEEGQCNFIINQP